MNLKTLFLVLLITFIYTSSSDCGSSSGVLDIDEDTVEGFQKVSTSKKNIPISTTIPIGQTPLPAGSLPSSTGPNSVTPCTGINTCHYACTDMFQQCSDPFANIMFDLSASSFSCPSSEISGNSCGCSSFMAILSSTQYTTYYNQISQACQAKGCTGYKIFNINNLQNGVGKNKKIVKF
jgi:hypothetical protein